MVNFLTRYDVKDIYLCYSLFLFRIGVGIGCAAQPIPFFGYAITHAHFVSLGLYELIGFYSSKLIYNVFRDKDS